MRRWLAAGAALVALAACTKVGPDTTTSTSAARNPWTVAHTLRIGEYQDLASLNPHIATALSLGNLSQLTMAWLLRFDHDNQPVPELATEVPTRKNGGISADGRTITWHLRHGVKWSDGAPFDGDDVVFSTRAVLNPKNNEVGRDGWDLITKIDEPDKFTVIFHLKSPYSGFIPSFFTSAGANPCILPKHILGSLPDFNNAPYNSKPIGIGPFRYVSWKRGESVELEANPNYWRGQPKIKKIVVRFIPDRNTLLTTLQTGEVDLVPYVGVGYIKRVEAIPSATTIHYPGFVFAHVDFNTQHAVFRDANVRRALRMATNRPEIVKTVNFGSGIVQENQLTPVSPLSSEIAFVPFDLAGANALLDRSGWKRGADGIRAKNGVRLNFTWATSSGAQDVDRMIEAIRYTWSKVGVSFQVQHVAPALFFGAYSAGGTLYSGKWDVTSFVWGQTPDGDFSATNGCTLIPPLGQNVTRLCDPQIESLLGAAKAAYDIDERKPILKKLSERISDLVPYYVLYIREDIHAYNRDLRGWHPNATTPFDDFLNVDI